MPQGIQQSPSGQAAVQGGSENGRVSDTQLSATQNPALARLAGAVRGQSAGDPAESYSRMHHRHNRS
jgi:hypothetical protein